VRRWQSMPRLGEIIRINFSLILLKIFLHFPVLWILNRVVSVSTLLKAHSQLDRNHVRLHAIARLLEGPDLSMPAHPVPDRHAPVHAMGAETGMRRTSTRVDARQIVL